jgi:hypothetical protein
VAAIPAGVAIVNQTTAGASQAPGSVIRYSVLDRAAAAGDAGPDNFSSIGTSRALPGIDGWVRVSDDRICVTGFVAATQPADQLTPPSACEPQTEADANGGVVTLGVDYTTKDGATTNSVLGVAPDGTTSVDLGLSDGTTVTVPVKGNAFEYSSAKAATSLTAITNGVSHAEILR